MLHEPDIDPKIRKSALVQISVMLSDSSLHTLFISENGLPLILKIFNSSLVNFIVFRLESKVNLINDLYFLDRKRLY